ncbi:MAG: BTAD domain-containing putative transcriptional regulator [Erysipelotrichaceae bacterium]|nr:BTAD domain-containing putative transcriptional regulator [Erysipelotrichaceae bacterium]
MKPRSQICMFGNLTITYNRKVFNLEDVLGRQLFNLFAYLSYQHRKTISKERLIAIFWQNSDNPESALKNAIFRLRTTLASHPILGKRAWIVTNHNGYRLNDEGLNIDTDEFDTANNRILSDSNLAISEYERLLELYQGSFLLNSQYDWAEIIRIHYHEIYLERMLRWITILDQAAQYEKVEEVCQHVLQFDQFNEDIQFYYLKALIELKRYNDAIIHYEQISRLFYQELGVPLLYKIQSLLNIISYKDEYKRTSLDDLMRNVQENQPESGAYRCEYSVFKGLFQLTKRKCLRTKITEYVILLEIKCKEKDIETIYTMRLMESVGKMLRKNDVYSQISRTQIALLVSMNKLEDGYNLLDRLLKEFYKHTPQERVKVNYYLSSVLMSEASKEITAVV